MRSIPIVVIFMIIVAVIIFVVKLFISTVKSAIQLKKQKISIKKLPRWGRVDSNSGNADADEALSVVLDLGKNKSSESNWDSLLRISDEELLCAMDKLADCYIHGADGTRDKVRTTCASQGWCMSGILLIYAKFSALKLDKRFRKEENAVILKRGVAAISIEDLRLDYRDSLMMVRKLKKHSLKVGLDPEASLLEIMRISSDVSPHPQIEGHPSMRAFLSDT